MGQKNESLNLWLSIGAAAFAVMLLYSYTQEKSSQVSKKFGTQTSIVTAVREIREMETVDDSMVELREYPETFVQPGALTAVEDVVGRVALAPISKGEQILKTKVVTPGPQTGLSLQVAPSKRAMTIPIDEMRGVAKLLKPGDRVDIIAALDIREGNAQRREVKTLMQDVLILATGIDVMNELPRVFDEVGGQSVIHNLRRATNFNTITVEARPEKIQDLVYVLSTSPGALFLSLRHPSDHNKTVHLAPSTLNSLLGKISKRRKPATTPKPPGPWRTVGP